ncbi:MAG TPA: hypothetical protein PKL75_12170 [Treponemataceae bacterium]|nr:hypothetical protein [Treponemataceae bacterium]
MCTLTIRGCDDALMDAIRRESQDRTESINKLVLEALEARYGKEKKSRRHSDLDALAGTWSEEDARVFAEALAGSRTVDPEDWK